MTGTVTTMMRDGDGDIYEGSEIALKAVFVLSGNKIQKDDWFDLKRTIYIM